MPSDKARRSATNLHATSLTRINPSNAHSAQTHTMTEWNKLKVPDLRAELKKRGLLQTGLKAELVARLTSADNESGFESETTVKGDSMEAGVESISPTVEAKSTLAESQPEVTAPVESQTQSTLEDTTLPASSGHSPAATVLETEASHPQSDPASNQDAECLKTSEPEDGAKSALPSVDIQELIEDKQKRKRRSKSPPQSALDVRRKRARPDDESDSATPEPKAPRKELVTSKADAEWTEKNNGVNSAIINAEAEEVASSSAAADSGPIIVDGAREEVMVDPVPNTKAEEDGEDRRGGGSAVGMETGQEIPSSALPLDDESSARTKDSRFKGLFANQPSKSGQESISDKPNTNFTSDTIDTKATDRYVAPSTHPATSALYIRDFMRPLNAASLKEHLTILATAPGTTPDPDTIVDFYIDPIRTHAFILFKSISAASRVRSELHDRIWPNERNRKPLWADFVPSEKVLEWIAEEQSSSGGARSAGKKWEVAFNTDEDGNVTAALREVGSFIAPARKPSIVVAPPLPAPSHSGIEGAPSGPRAQQINGQRAAPNRSALDTLFKYTTAKPVLYYQPVSRELAEKRLDHMEDATSKHYSSRAAATDIHRYTFEDGDILVDRGPEIFSGIRPPPGYRGRGGGGGGGRGGFRSRGGDRYEGSRRGAWDSRDRDRDRDRRY
jgi:SAP domain